MHCLSSFFTSNPKMASRGKSNSNRSICAISQHYLKSTIDNRSAIRLSDYLAASQRSLGDRFGSKFTNFDHSRNFAFTHLLWPGRFASSIFLKDRRVTLFNYWQSVSLGIAPWSPMEMVSSGCVRVNSQWQSLAKIGRKERDALSVLG